MPDVSINYKGKSESAEAAARRVAIANEKAALQSEAAWKKAGTSVGRITSVAATGDVKGLAAGVGALGGSAVFAAGAALSGVALGLKSVVDAGRDQLRAGRLTEAVLISTGGAAGVSAKQIEDNASALSLMSGVQDEVIQSGENVLLTFRSVRNEAGKGNDIFTQGTKAALDLSAALGRDLQSSVIAVGKALNDPIQGMTALRRSGVSFTESQKEQIKTLTESGHLLEAQKVILGELKAEFGGAAAAAADPFSKLNASVHEAQESIGKGLIPTLSAYVSLLAKGVKFATDFGGALTPRPGADTQLTSGAKDAGRGALTTLLLGPVGLFANRDSGKQEDAATAAANRLAAALRKLVVDSATAGTSERQLAKDAAEVHAAQNAVTAITGRAAAALGDNAVQADKAAFAYLGLGKNVKTAAQAIDAINTRAFAGLNVGVAKDTAGTNVQQALHDLNHPNADTSGGGGGGSGQTATAKAIEHAQKELGVRDALQGVTDAAQGVKDAEQQLNQARHDAITSQQELTTAAQNYQNVLHGVGTEAKAAKDALDQLNRARTGAAQGQLSVRDAQRNLAQAKNDKELFALNVKEAQKKLDEDRGKGGAGAKFVPGVKGSVQVSSEKADPDQIRRDEIALNDARIAASGADDSVRKAELDLQQAREDAKQSTKDAAEAQRVYNGTVHGFPPTSKEAKDATDQLSGAYVNALQAANNVATAQRGVATATNQVATAALEARRAQADLNGQLESGKGATAAGKRLDSLQTKLDAAKTSIRDFATAAFDADQAAGHSFAHSIGVEIGVLRTLAGANPLLAHAFDGALSELQRDFDAQVAKQFGSDQGKGVRVGPNLRRFADGGVVPGRIGSEQLIIAHGGETVVPTHKSIRNLRTFTPGGGGSPIIVNINGPIMGTDVEEMVHRALKNLTRKNGSVPHVRVSG